MKIQNDYCYKKLDLLSCAWYICSRVIFRDFIWSPYENVSWSYHTDTSPKGYSDLHCTTFYSIRFLPKHNDVIKPKQCLYDQNPWYKLIDGCIGSHLMHFYVSNPLFRNLTIHFYCYHMLRITIKVLKGQVIKANSDFRKALLLN